MAGVLVFPQLENELQILVDNFEGYKIGLYTNSITPTVDTELAELNEAVFDGYTDAYPPDGRAPLEGWAGVIWNVDENWAEVSATPRIWTLTNTTTLENCYGYFVLNELSELAWVTPFQSGPVMLETIGQSIVVVVRRNYTSPITP